MDRIAHFTALLAQNPANTLFRFSLSQALLAAGRGSGADYLITGDKDLLALGARYPIISPAQFWTAHGGI